MAKGIDVVRMYDMPEDELDAKTTEAFAGIKLEDMGLKYEESVREFEEDTILKGRVLNVVNDEVIVDIGYKSEGVIPLYEFGENADIDVGDEIEVLLDEIEDETGMIRLSKRKADRIRAWNEILKTHKEGDVVRGTVQRKIKGGLLVDVGVPVFLPASQVSLRRTADISEFIGQEIEARIIKIDEQRMNIVVSRRKLVEEQREAAKKKLLGGDPGGRDPPRRGQEHRRLRRVRRPRRHRRPAAHHRHELDTHQPPLRGRSRSTRRWR